ncbi:MAG: PEP/pyruvate-binding domain-containing protein, partial [Anaerolineae bacterium]|nr:PEP/pyruvate-binding domain-containing protein [Anaerolineae bacterium]
MTDVPFEAPKILSIYLQIANYPIMAHQIRERMRGELFRRGVITPDALEEEVHAKATLSQQREGLVDPLSEAPHVWAQRLQTIRDHLTDFYFAYNLPIDLFQQIVNDLLAERSVTQSALDLHFNPELAPLDLLLQQAARYEALSEHQRAQVQHHLEEIMVVLIKTIISDHLGFLRVAKHWFSADDLHFVQSRRIGKGKIGGKAAGMLLAWRILKQSAPEIAAHVTIPESYFIGTDVFYEFLSLNSLEYFNQKYKPLDQIRADYPQIMAAYERGRFPQDVADQLRAILEQVGDTPLIVRSSSLLEDNFGTSFAGKYESYFCPNQGTPEENLDYLTLAIRRVYASAFNPDVMLYRRQMGLLDYDERMAILLQEVQGQVYGRYFFPTVAGVGFSYAPILWHSRLRREDGFIRLVAGLGTRAVNRIPDDYARLVTLSHPQLRPETSPQAIRRYSQHCIDVIDLQENTLETLPIANVIGLDYPGLRLIASVEEQDTLMPLLSLGRVSPDDLVYTFDTLLQRGRFAPMVKGILATLNEEYQFPVDVEFAVTLTPDQQLAFHLLQCRPQSSMAGQPVRPVPTDVPEEKQIFQVTRMVPQGEIDCVEYIIYVEPLRYSQLEPPTRKHEVARVVGRLNKLLEGCCFIMLGPGRWGSANPELGVPISYADIYNARALVEVAVPQQGISPEPSYGTHFFQDLVEAEIYPLAIYLGEEGDF